MKHYEYKPTPDMPIGVFDSGLGGLSTLREIRRLLPGEDIIYYGDHANAPYGSKSAEEVKMLSFECAGYLLDREVKALVIACNTATSAAATDLRAACKNIRIIGAEPAVKPAVTDFPGSEIIVMATETTLAERKFKDLCAEYENVADIIPLSCPGLVEFIERGELCGDALDKYLSEKLSPVITSRTRAIVLGCTHYPFISESISKAAGGEIRLYDGNRGIARELSRRLGELGLLRGGEHGTVEYTGSGMREAVRKITAKLTQG